MTKNRFSEYFTVSNEKRSMEREKLEVVQSEDKQFLVRYSPIPKYLIYFHNFCYYSCFTPFRIEPGASPNSPISVIQSHKIHQTICGTIHISYFLFWLSLIHDTVSYMNEIEHINPEMYSYLLGYIAVTLSCLNFFHNCWSDTKGFKTLCRTLLNQEGCYPRALNWKEKLLSLLIVGACAIVYNLAHVLILLKLGFWKGMQSSFVNNSIVNRIVDVTSEADDTQTKILIPLFYCIRVYFNNLQIVCSLASSLFHLFIFYQTATETEELMGYYKSTSLSAVSRHYANVRNTVSEINRCVGMSFLLTNIISLLFFSSSLIFLFTPIASTIDIIALTWQIFITAFFYCLAAEGGEKLACLPELFYARRNEPGFKNNLEIITILAQPHLQVKAFRFNITYGFMAMNFSTVLTYSVIFLQLKAKSK